MNFIRKVANYILKQVIAILVAAGIIAGTVVCMILAALFVTLFGLGAAFFFLIAPMLGIVMREKMKGWPVTVDELKVKLEEVAASVNKR